MQHPCNKTNDSCTIYIGAKQIKTSMSNLCDYINIKAGNKGQRMAGRIRHRVKPWGQADHYSQNKDISLVYRSQTCSLNTFILHCKLMVALFPWTTETRDELGNHQFQHVPTKLFMRSSLEWQVQYHWRERDDHYSVYYINLVSMNWSRAKWTLKKTPQAA